MRIKLFEQFINEGSQIEKVQDLFETDFLEQQFVKDSFGENPDYDIDNDTTPSPEGGLDKIVWIEIKNPTDEAKQAIDKDYKTFAKPFEEWAAKHDLYNPEITTSDDEDTASSMSFKITILK